MANGKENALKKVAGRRQSMSAEQTLTGAGLGLMSAATAVMTGATGVGLAGAAALGALSAGAFANAKGDAQKAKRLSRIGTAGKYKAATTKLKASKKAAAKKSGGTGAVKTHARRTKTGKTATVKQHMRKAK